jgi:hypothetical protein
VRLTTRTVEPGAAAQAGSIDVEEPRPISRPADVADASFSIPLRLVSAAPWPWAAIETAVLRVDSGIPKAVASPPPNTAVRPVRARSSDVAVVVREKEREMAGSSNSTAALMVTFAIFLQPVEDGTDSLRGKRLEEALNVSPGI